jgi:glutamyl-tRNA synthetase
MNTQKTVRTRFSPSPTGFQHIGGFRTALYAWLWAKKNNGQFLLRVEDTDQERKVAGATSYIVDSLDWLGINYDEGPSRNELKLMGEDTEKAPTQDGRCAPYIQSQRKKRHQEIAEQLIEMGVAYRCDCTPERLEAERKEQAERKENTGYSGYCRNRNVSKDSKHVIRLKIPDNLKITLNDIVRGEIVFDNPSLKDTVLLKSDGMPTYHLACMVDDHDMEITHVMRGEEWLPTAPVHLLLYKYLGWEPPQFCHLSQILAKDGKKLSKRHGAEALNYFKDAGYLPDAIVNYIARVGWSLGDGDEQEIFTRQELIEKFSLDRLQKAGGVYDPEKLLWVNSQIIHRMSDQDFMLACKPFFEKAGYQFNQERFLPLAKDLKERCKLLTDCIPFAEFLFKNEIIFNPNDLYKKEINKDNCKVIVERCLYGFKELQVFNHSSIELLMRGYAEELNLKPGSLFSVIRVVLTGSMVTPPIFESLAALGKEEVLKRLENALKVLN